MKPRVPWAFVVPAVIIGALVGGLALSGHAQPQTPHAPTPPTLRTAPAVKLLTPLESDVLALQNTVTQQAGALNALTTRVQALETRLTQAESKLAVHDRKITLLCANQGQIPFGLPGVKLATCE